MLQLDPDRPVAEPVDAATLILARPAEPSRYTAEIGAQHSGIEVFFVRRHARSPFLGGAVVFPGGKLDPSDRHDRGNGLHPRALDRNFAADPAHACALAACACRECLEEAAIALTVPALDDARARQMQADLQGGAGYAAVLASAQIDTRALAPFARWITPKAETRRYDTRFFLGAAPDGQRGRCDERETVSAVWATPKRMLAAFAAGDVFLAPPTLRALELLREAATVPAAIDIAAQQSLRPICPTFVPGPPPMLVIPGDPLHEERDRRVAGGTRFVLRDGRFVSEEP